MLRIFFSLLVFSLAGGMMGCGGDHQLCYHNSGICDCDRDDEPCAHRAPWGVPMTPTILNSPVAPMPAGQPLPAPLPNPKNMPMP